MSSSTHPSAVGRFGRTGRLLAFAISCAVIAFLGGSGARAAAAAPQISNPFGTLAVSPVTGQTAKGATFEGQYRVTRFVVQNDRAKAVGRLTGTLTKKSGATEDVSQRVRMPVNLKATRAGQPTAPGSSSRAANGVVGCEILNLVLGPLDLDLLGLVVQLDQVVLNITAVPGAGNLLGNLLCAIVGLLDGASIPGLGAILADILNAILGILRS